MGKFEIVPPSNLPFKYRGLKWNGKDAMTSDQLQHKRNKKRAKIGKGNGKRKITEVEKSNGNGDTMEGVSD